MKYFHKEFYKEIISLNSPLPLKYIDSITTGF